MLTSVSYMIRPIEMLSLFGAAPEEILNSTGQKHDSTYNRSDIIKSPLRDSGLLPTKSVYLLSAMTERVDRFKWTTGGDPTLLHKTRIATGGSGSVHEVCALASLE